MKTTIYMILLILLCVSLSNADDKGTVFIKSSWDEVIKKAKAENKLIFVDAYTDWCGWCGVMDEKTFSDSTIAEFLHKHFVPVKFDMEKGDGVKLAIKYCVTGFPSFLVFNSNGRLVFTTAGYQPPVDFIEELKKAIDPQYWDDAPGVSESIDMNYPDFYKAAFIKNEDGRATWPDSATVPEYFSQNKDWLSEISWLVIQRFKAPNEVYDYFLKNFEIYNELFYDEDVTHQLYIIFHHKLYEAVEQKSEQLLDDLVSMAYKYLPERKEENANFYTITYYKMTENWSSYFQSVKSNIDKNGFDDINGINEYCWTIYENVDDKEAIQSAIIWMEKVTKKDPQWAYMDTYASLLFKNGDYQKAKEIAEKAIKTGKENNKKIEPTEELLEKILEEMNK